MAKVRCTWWQKLEDEYIIDIPEDATDKKIDDIVAEFCYSLTEYLQWERIDEEEE